MNSVDNLRFRRRFNLMNIFIRYSVIDGFQSNRLCSFFVNFLFMVHRFINVAFSYSVRFPLPFVPIYARARLKVKEKKNLFVFDGVS